jgi:hypothetical protein
MVGNVSAGLSDRKVPAVTAAERHARGWTPVCADDEASYLASCQIMPLMAAPRFLGPALQPRGDMVATYTSCADPASSVSG